MVQHAEHDFFHYLISDRPNATRMSAQSGTKREPDIAHDHRTINMYFDAKSKGSCLVSCRNAAHLTLYMYNTYPST